MLSLALSASAWPAPTSVQTTSYCCGSVLSKIGKAVTYPVKKAAGNGSQTVSHTGQAVQYPVQKTGENTSKAVHKAGVK